MHEILDIAKANDMVVASGHVSPEEHLVLVAEAHRRGIHRVVISHVRDEISLEDRKRMAKQGAVVELVYRAGQDARSLIEAACAVGVQQPSRRNAKHAEKEIYSIFRALAPFAPLRDTLFSDFFLNSEFQIPLVSI